jgi:hypothetical protein
MSLNIFYIIAIVLGGGALLFGYLGSAYDSKKSSEEQISKISIKFDKLGTQIAQLQSISNPGNEEINKLTKEYGNIAKEYIQVMPQKAQQLKVAQEQKKLNEIQESRHLQKDLDYIEQNLRALINGFNAQGAKIRYETMQFPSNIFSKEPYQLKVIIDEKDYWSIHFVDREMDKIGLMIVRIVNEKGIEMLTDDSIILRWQGNQYGFSLNSRISSEVKDNVMQGITLSLKPLAQLHIELKTLLINLTKYELARKR